MLNQPGPYAKRYIPEGAPGLFFGDYCNWARIEEYRAFFYDAQRDRYDIRARDLAPGDCIAFHGV
jgi:hypothetical protein